MAMYLRATAQLEGCFCVVRIDVPVIVRLKCVLDMTGIPAEQR